MGCRGERILSLADKIRHLRIDCKKNKNNTKL